MKLTHEKGSRNGLSTARDLALLVYVYQKQGHREELLSILDNERIGINSRIGFGDSQFVQAKISILEERQMWPELQAFCQSLLQDVISSYEKTCADGSISTLPREPKDDWSVFAAFIHALQYSNSELVGPPRLYCLVC